MEEIRCFLKRHGMSHETLDIQKEAQRFVAQMELGLKGEESSLMMLPTYLKSQGAITKNQKVLVLDMGGTNLRTAVVELGETGSQISYFKKCPMPGTQGPMEKDEFFKAIARQLLPVADQSDRLGVCFSYAAQLQPNRDGIALEVSKGLQVRGLKGVSVCEEINRALEKLAPGQRKKAVMLNDTVATMLGGRQEKEYSGYVGFVLGTGTNTCYTERGANITKLPAQYRGDDMIINTESGGYAGMPRGDMNRALDEMTDNPGEHTYEKMVSGAYQPRLIHLMLCQGAKEGLFTEAPPRVFPMQEVTEFLREPTGQNPMADWLRQRPSDREKVTCLLQENIERCAKLVCINLLAVLLKTGCGQKGQPPVAIVAEGTTYEKNPWLKQRLMELAKEHITKAHGISFEILQEEDANLKGSAWAALWNG